MTKIKICGLRRRIDIDYVNAISPDFIGFVFVRESSRYIKPEEAKSLRSRLQSGIVPVGVFADEPVENVARMLEEGIIDIAQLHGREDDSYIARLRQMTDRSIIQAFGVSSAADITRASHSPADYILFDNCCGGSGKAFDWSHLCDIQHLFFLAGGLNEANIKQAISLLRPYAVDISSSVETNKFKDPDKMRSFVGAVRDV